MQKLDYVRCKLRNLHWKDFSIKSREITYGSNKYIWSFLYWETVDMVSQMIIFVIMLYLAKWFGIITFSWV